MKLPLHDDSLLTTASKFDTIDTND